MAADRPACARLLAVAPAGRSTASYTITRDATADHHSGERFASFAMVSPGKRLEGIVVLERGRQMQLSPFTEGATMHYLATAPWNRLKRDGTQLLPDYDRARPVGSVLLTRAFMYSRDMGYEGRMNWESLEG